MEVNEEYLVRILSYPKDKYPPAYVTDTPTKYVCLNFSHFRISFNINSLAIDVWIEAECAWVETSIPYGVSPNAYLSKHLRWVLDRLLEREFVKREDELQEKLQKWDNQLKQYQNRQNEINRDISESFERGI